VTHRPAVAATREEVAAVVAVTAVLEQEGRGAPAPAPAVRSAWVDVSRRSAQRAMMQRGPWRLSGRLGRRSRT